MKSRSRMDTLLALETADTTCGVAVWQNDTCRAAAHIHRPRVHAARLTPLIEETLGHAGISSEQLDAVAVSAGPGSYTGLRIGMSTAKGFAMALGIPLVPVPTLEAAACALASWVEPGDYVVAALDARRNDVFAAAYQRTAHSWDPVIEAGPYAVDALVDTLSTDTPNRVWCAGPGAEKVASGLQEHGERSTAERDEVRVVSSHNQRLSARHIAERGIHRARRGDLADPLTVEPAYLKAFHGTPSAKSV